MYITIFSYSVFTLHIVSMSIFFVVVLETKKLLIHLLLTCLIYTEAVANKSFTRKKAFFRSSHTEKFLAKGVLKICSKITGEHPCRSVISVTLESNFIEMALRHGCSTVNLLHIFRTALFKNTSGGLGYTYGDKSFLLLPFLSRQQKIILSIWERRFAYILYLQNTLKFS